MHTSREGIVSLKDALALILGESLRRSERESEHEHDGGSRGGGGGGGGSAHTITHARAPPPAAAVELMEVLTEERLE